MKEFFKNTINLTSLTPQSAFFGFVQTDQELFYILNYFLLLFKYYLYVSRCSKTISFEALETNIKKTYILKKIFPNMIKRRKGLIFKFLKQNKNLEIKKNYLDYTCRLKAISFFLYLSQYKNFQ